MMAGQISGILGVLSLQSLTLLVLSVASLFLLTWCITSWTAHRAFALSKATAPGLKRPPTLPYAVPFLGHVIEFMRDGNGFMSRTAQYLDRNIPVRIILPIFSNYVVSGPENVLAYFRESHNLSTTTRSVIVMKNAFGCPGHLVHQFEPRVIPLGTKLEDNIEHQILRAVNSGLSGSHLDGLSSRFQENMAAKIRTDQSDELFDNEWKALPDINGFVENRVFEAAVASMFGTFMVSLNPTLAEDFWNFNRYIGALFMGLPSFLNPKAIKAREKMVDNIKRWLRFTAENCPVESLGDVDWEPYYGSKFTRERQVLLTKRGIVDETARAAENFAFLWATNSNSVPAATWFLIECLHDPSLKQRVLDCIPACIDEASSLSERPPKFDIVKLCDDPLLSSVYAETLRLRTAVLVVRQPTSDDFSFRGWHIKKDEVLSLSTRTEQMNEDIWNSKHRPLEEFYSDRFIIDPKEPNSGPLRNQKVKSKDGKPYFAMDGLRGSWVPYGGGNHLCPGRHFAKREIITATVMFLSAYEMEMVDEGKGKPEVDMKCFGFGTMPPNRAIPFRIKRRET